MDRYTCQFSHARDTRALVCDANAHLRRGCGSVAAPIDQTAQTPNSLHPRRAEAVRTEQHPTIVKEEARDTDADQSSIKSERTPQARRALNQLRPDSRASKPRHRNDH